jgi:hypothetical protein
MAAFTALALGLLGGALLGKLGSGGDDSTQQDGRTTIGRTDPNAPKPGTVAPLAPPSTAKNAADAIPAAQSAAERTKKRAAAGDTLLTPAQTPTNTATAQVQPVKLIGT